MKTPAKQLGSVAVRYDGPLQPPSLVRGLVRLSQRKPGQAGSRPPALGHSRPPEREAASSSSRPARRSRLEAVLFLSREPLSLRRLARLANLADATEARTLLTDLRRCYDARGSAFQVEQVAGGYRLLTRPQFAPWLKGLVPREQMVRLSPPALETLAVVAYRQPVLRAEVEAIRGVTCGELLRQLMDQNLLRIVGRSDELGRPLWYGTTKRFLQVFGVRDLDQLPLAAELRRGLASPDRSVASSNSATPRYDEPTDTGAAGDAA